MSDPQIRKLIREIRGIDKRVSALSSSSRLVNASIENGAVEEYDLDGNLVGRIGRQHDGTHAAASLFGPIPPTPTAPTVSGEHNALTITWDGTFEDDKRVPMDFQTVQVGTTSVPGGVPTLAGVITSEAGGAKTLSVTVGTHWVALRSRSQSGRVSPWSALVEVEVEPIGVDPEIIDDLNNRLDVLNDSLDDLDETILPELRGRMDDAFTEIEGVGDRADQAAADATAAATAAQAAQSTAEDAEQAALDAAGIAEGKGQVITQTSAPTGSRARAENLWVRLPDHKVHVYDGDQWVAATDPDLIAAAGEAATARQEAQAAQSAAEAAQGAADALEGQVTTLRDDLETAEAAIATVRDTTIPALNADLTTLRDTTVPELTGRLDDAFVAVGEAQQAADEAQSDATAAAGAASAAQQAADEAGARVQAAIARGDNLIYNGDFEAGDDGWSTTDTQHTVERPDARSGSRVMFLDTAQGANRWPTSEYVSTSEGRAYYIEAWYRRSGTDESGRVGIYTQTLTAGGSRVGSFAGSRTNVSDLPEGEWVRVSARFTVSEPDAISIGFAPWAQGGGNTYDVDDMLAVDITEAAAAQQRADEAHDAAGTAQDTADAAMTAAGTKTTVTYSTSAPAGVGQTEGDTHRRRDSSGNIVAEWSWDGDAWQSQQITSEQISNLDVGKLTAGTAEIAEVVADAIWAAKITSRKVLANEVLIGGAQNLWPDPDFAEDVYKSWTRVDSGIEQDGQGSGLSVSYIDTEDAFYIPHNKGDVYRVTADFTMDGEGGRGEIWFREADGNRSYVSGSASSVYVPESGAVETIFEPRYPDGEDAAKFVYFGFGMRDVPTSSRVRWENFRVQTMVDHSLIVDGGILARHITASEAMSAKLAEFLEVRADQITAGQIGAARINTSELAAEMATVIDLAAERITSGTINTERLDAAEVAGAVGTFLDLRADQITAIGAGFHQVVANQMFADIFAANKVTASEIDVDDLAANQAFIDELSAGIITAENFEGKSFSGVSFQGSTFTTDNSTGGGIYLGPDVSSDAIVNGMLKFGDPSSMHTPEIVFHAMGALRTQTLLIKGPGDGGAFTGSEISMDAYGLLNLTPTRASSEQAGVSVGGPWSPVVIHGGETNLWSDYGVYVRPSLTIGNGDQYNPTNRMLRLEPSTGTSGAASDTWIRGGPGALMITAPGQVRFPDQGEVTSSANAHLANSGLLRRGSTSRSEYKVAMEKVGLERAEAVLDLEPITWYDRTNTETYARYLDEGAQDEHLLGDVMKVQRIGGLSIENMLSAGLRDFVQAGADGDPETIDYDRVWTLLIPVVRDLRNRVMELEKN